MNSVKKILVGTACSALMVSALALTACGGSGSTAASLADGTYSGTSSVMEANVDGDGYVTVELTVQDGKISDVKHQAFLPDGTLKDDSYGKETAYYAVAQKVLAAGDEYADQLLQSGSADAIDTVSGATYLHDQFVEAVEDALSKAAE